jgi:intergrase/recombinase
MSNLLKCLLCVFFIQGSFSLQAQDLVTSFLDKHGKDDNLKIVSIGEKMLDMVSNLTLGYPELNKVIKNLDNIRFVCSQDTILSEEYYESANQLLKKSKGFEEILSVNNDEEKLLVMVREAKGTVKELVLLSSKVTGFNLILMSGDINLDALVRYSGSLSMKKT